MRITLLLALTMLSIVLASCARPPSEAPEQAGELALDSLFRDIEGTFVLLDQRTGERHVYNAERAGQRYLPASTFKIPNSLIALETGVVDGPDFALQWDSLKAPRGPFWPQSWTGRHTLRSALQNSVVWYYQEVARRIGPERMQAYLKQLDYGNRDISGGIDQFWLRGGLRISAEEQVDFLQRFYFGKLGVSRRSTDIVKEIMVLEETPQYRLSGKTGTAELTATRELGWLVGYLEKGERVYFYALNMEGERVFEDYPPSARKEFVLGILRRAGVVPH